MPSSICLVLLLTLWSSTECCSPTLTLTPIPTSFNGLEVQNANLTCASSKDAQTEIESMRILTLKNNEWTPVVTMDADWQGPKMLGVKGSVLAQRKDKTYFQVTWGLDTSTVGGQYMCDVIGYNRGQEEGIWKTSPMVNVGEAVGISALHEMIDDMNEKTELSLKDLAIVKENSNLLQKEQKDLGDAIKQI